MLITIKNKMLDFSHRTKTVITNFYKPYWYDYFIKVVVYDYFR